MKFEVDKDTCIGCGACQAICPEVFEIDDTGLASAIGEASDDVVDAATDAMEGCPVNAIDKAE